MKQNSRAKVFNPITSKWIRAILLLCVGLIYHSPTLYGAHSHRNLRHNNPKTLTSIDTQSIAEQTLTYYLFVSDFINSFIQIPTSNVSVDSTTINSTYLAGRAPIYNNANNAKVGTCSASFLCMQTGDGIYTDISNYLSVDSGLVVSWFTPTTLINLELDSIINSMVTDCMVTASTKIGVNPFYGQTFDLVVSSQDGKIYFVFTRTGTIF